MNVQIINRFPCHCCINHVNIVTKTYILNLTKDKSIVFTNSPISLREIYEFKVAQIIDHFRGEINNSPRWKLIKLILFPVFPQSTILFLVVPMRTTEGIFYGFSVKFPGMTRFSRELLTFSTKFSYNTDTHSLNSASAILYSHFTCSQSFLQEIKRFSTICDRREPVEKISKAQQMLDQILTDEINSVQRDTTVFGSISVGRLAVTPIIFIKTFMRFTYVLCLAVTFTVAFTLYAWGRDYTYFWPKRSNCTVWHVSRYYVLIIRKHIFVQNNNIVHFDNEYDWY